MLSASPRSIRLLRALDRPALQDFLESGKDLSVRKCLLSRFRAFQAFAGQ